MAAVDEMFLFQQLDIFHDFGQVRELPPAVVNNLNSHIALREYQKHAFSNFMEYEDNEKLSKNKQTHLLFHMATGSGKTVMMAGLVLYYYQRGYRNFLFFVNQTNIIEKTKANFLDSSSSKYLFADSIEIDGKRVAAKEVQNFSAPDPDAINLCFTTTQKLHMDFIDPKENSLTRDDFEDQPVVMLSDESHHVNTRTKKATKAEDEEDRSWEYTVANLLVGNRENVLLEFTATVDLRDKNINAKYRDKIVFDYPLSKFRESGFTKDFQNLQADLGLWERTLQALLLSEYRRSLFADCGVAAKPVVLLKSQRIDDSKAFYEEFFRKLTALDQSELVGLDTGGLPSEALAYFRAKDPSLSSLCRSIQQGFAEENAIIMNGSTDNSTAKQLAVNSLEDQSNPYRIIFTVDMLNEGWDVLNLFDIVRLYDTRQGGKAGKPGSYTIKEAQLIGRGARYYPFIPDDELETRDQSERFVRKYDNDITSSRRLLETLLYHSKQDSKYIAELRLALKETGLLPEEIKEFTYALKPEFRSSDFFKSAKVFANKRVEVSRESVTELDNRIKSGIYNVSVRAAGSRLLSLFGEEGSSSYEVTNLSTHTVKIKDMPLNVVLGTIDRFDALRFEALKHYFPHLNSVLEFVTDPAYLGDTEINFESDHEQLAASDYMAGLNNVFAAVANYLTTIQVTYRGTREFEARPLMTTLRDKTIQVTKIVEGGIGTSQNEMVGSDLYVDLLNADWYAQTDNYGTSEEKAFVRFFAGVASELKSKYEEVYLVRNERIPELAIYTFDTGERFEPDFLLFLRRKGVSTYEQEQIYIEPKGSQLLETDKWKEDFLLQIEENAIPHSVYVDNSKYRIIGLPFFNTEHRMSEFREALEGAVR
ncbi:DEAD/DEAH box helicase family protein [Propionimicrobium lymphophilum]|uniref:DEAD/DEAH box helicase family protein n=1 Tax=Propionimicrobium lymphophilum TaxID=33012 RepID=UPI0023F54657|nr:DEAD/DEAH box helicase family protein [Propionimicrobium lymphophilum]